MSKKTKVVLGADPGKSGAICLMEPSTLRIAFHDTVSTPTELLQWIEKIKEEFHIVGFAVEQVHALPGSSAGSSFTFGRGYERMLFLAQTVGCPVFNVTPKTWQSFIGLSVPRKIKGAARKKAIKTGVAELVCQLYPTARELCYGPKGGLLDGNTDSLAITHYIWHHYNL